MPYPATYQATYAETPSTGGSLYPDVAVRIARLLGSSTSALDDDFFDADIALTIRANLPPPLLQGQTWQSFYASLSGDDLSAFDEALALLVSADAYPTLTVGASGGAVTMRQLGDQRLSYDTFSTTDVLTVADQWRRRAAVLLASLSFAATIARRIPSISGVNGPSRQRMAQWGRGE